MSTEPSPWALPLPSMSIHIEGLLVSSVAFSGAPRAVVSDSFARSLRLAKSRPLKLLLTTVIPSYGPYATAIEVDFNKSTTHGISLDYDWTSHLRESLIWSGYHPGSSFNA
ncbi:hypothetical protein B0H13DRAFT_2312342 [Mycena leptocephala]|nr:hypothetical protein B0H13DRAFT_2312342 [Mycena leptocephala]